MDMATFKSPLSTSRIARLAGVSALFTLASLVEPTTATATPNLVEVCHPLGNGGFISIFVNANAVPAHLAQGGWLPTTYYADTDGDGFGDPDVTAEGCEAPDGFVDNSDDCDDSDPALALDCDSTSFGSCLDATEITTCDVDLATGAVSCDNGTPISLYSGSNGSLTFRLDMTEWEAVSAVMDLDDPTGYWFNLGNSRTNNGWSGDGSTNSNDSEANAFNGGMYVFRSDLGGSGGAMSTPALDPTQDVGVATACDGYFSYESSLGFSEVYDDYIMQIDGDEIDPQAGGLNDTILWLGVNQVVNGGRKGTGVVGLTVVFGRS